MPKKLSNDELIIKFLANDHEAGRKLEELINSAFYSFQKRFGGSEKKIKADVLYKLFMEFRKGNPRDKSKLKAYIKTVMKNTCLEQLRYDKRFEDREIEDLPPEILPQNVKKLYETDLTPEKRLELKQLARISFRVFRRIPEKCRILWRMSLKEGMTYNEIGKLLGIDTGTVKWWMNKCREKAREIREEILKNDQPF